MQTLRTTEGDAGMIQGIPFAVVRQRGGDAEWLLGDKPHETPQYLRKEAERRRRLLTTVAKIGKISSNSE